jgi:hypothetical protein
VTKQKSLNDTLEGEIAAVLSLSSSGFVLKPKLIYAISDQLKMTVEAELFRGTEEGFFRRLRDASTVFAELKYSF